jgi:uncharacterized protein (TIGR03435 family)
MSLRILAALLAALLAAAPVAGQTFEVASLKALPPAAETPGGLRSTGMMPPIIGDPVQISYPNVSLLGILVRAYNLKPLQIDAPGWMRDNRYSLAAKVPDGAPKGQIPAMLQNLLADRFKVRVHWETKEAQGYALTVAKSGPKLTRSAISEADAPQKRSMSMSPSGHLEWRAESLEELASTLSVLTGSPVVDMTDLPGVFDIALDASPDSLPGLAFGPKVTDSPNPSIFSAIRALGLNLEARKVPVKRLVVDSAEKVPTPN